jgi:hypothetical protein
MEIVLVAGAVSAFATALITAIIARILCSKRLTPLSELYGQEQTVRDALEKCQSELSEVTDRLSEAKTAAQKQLAGYAQAVDRKKAQTDSQLKAFETIQADTVAKRQALEDELSALQGKLSTDREALRALEERTRHLFEVEKRATVVAAELRDRSAQLDDVKARLGETEDELHDLQSRLDLYTRIDEFVGYGLFEEPDYLHETPERYQAEIKKVREQQKAAVRDNKAVELPGDVEIDGSTKTGAAVLKGQAKLVLNAFNLECDLLIGKVNPSNFDRTLDQIATKAESIEKNMVSVRAGIAQQYLELKFQECRLVYEHALRKAERDEENRLARERIREEAKVAKEYEQALAKAEQEERVYKDLLEKARLNLQSAHEDEKADLEAKIMVLETQLREAGDAKQRAKSMAEQTRRGFIYVISNVGSFGEGVYKIGLTRRLDPMDRVKELGDASVPFAFDVHAFVYSEDAPAMEAELHRRFSSARVNAVNLRKEFFTADLGEIQSAVEELAGKEADFLVKPTAEEYYESLRLQG